MKSERDMEVSCDKGALSLFGSGGSGDGGTDLPAESGSGNEEIPTEAPSMSSLASGCPEIIPEVFFLSQQFCAVTGRNTG